jgi:hypothetical protein
MLRSGPLLGLKLRLFVGDSRVGFWIESAKPLLKVVVVLMLLMGEDKGNKIGLHPEGDFWSWRWFMILDSAELVGQLMLISSSRDFLFLEREGRLLFFEVKLKAGTDTFEVEVLEP